MNTQQTFSPELINEAAQKVADLWAAQLVKPLNKDNGDANDLLFLLASMNTVHAQRNIGQDNLDRFKQSIVRQLTEQFNTFGGHYIQISTDYSPDLTLARACQESEIPFDALPWKSCTSISLREKQVDYTFGYTAPWTKVSLHTPT